MTDTVDVKSKLICDNFGECKGRLLTRKRTRKEPDEKLPIPWVVGFNMETYCKETNDECSGELVSDYGGCVEWCEICDGIGVVSFAVDEWENSQFGKTKPCPNKIHKWRRGTGLDQSESGIDWEDMQQTDQAKQMIPAIKRMIESGYGMIYIWGVPGVGKTMSGKRAVMDATRKGFNSKYVRHSPLMDWMRSTFDEEYSQALMRSRMEEIAEYDLLVIDELGRDRGTDFSKDKLSEILELRYSNAINKKTMTVWISNFAPGEVLGGYQKDRIEDGRFEVIHVGGPSMRPLSNQF